MTNSKQLIKKLTVILSIILIIVIGSLIISSCQKEKPRLYGNIEKEQEYLSFGDYKVTNKELYDLLITQKSSTKHNTSVFIDDEIAKLIVKDELAKIQENLEPYKKDLNKKVLTAIYSSTEIPENEFTKKQNEYKYIDSLINHGIVIDYNDLYVNFSEEIDEITFNTKVYEQFYLKQAKELFALKKLEKEITDGDVTISEEEIQSYFDTNYKEDHDTSSVDALLISFINANESTFALRLIPKGTLTFANTEFTYQGIKSKNNKFYAIPTCVVKDDDGNVVEDVECTATEAKTWYDNYTINEKKALKFDDNGKLIEFPDTSLSNVEVLRIFLNIYNYLYKYKEITTDFSTLTEDEIITQLTALQEANDVKITYTAKELTEISSTLKTYIYDTLKTDGTAPKYTSSARSYSTRNYLIYKLSKETEVDFAPILDEHKDEIIAEIKKSKLTEEYVTAALNEEIENVDVKIYDSLIDTLYALDNSSYEKTKKQSDKELIALKYKGTEIKFTHQDLFNELKKKTGVSVSYDILLKKVLDNLNDGKYRQEALKDKDDYKKEIESILANFSADYFSYYGYPANMGRSNFLKVYFNANTIDEAINNYFVKNKIVELFLRDKPFATKDAKGNDKDSDVQKLYEIISNIYNDYLNYSATSLQVYVDYNEDDKADSLDLLVEEGIINATKRTSLEQLFTELLSDVRTRLEESTNVSFNSTLDTIITEYNNAYRMDPNTLIAPNITDNDFSSEIQTAAKWYKYKEQGIQIKKNTYSVTNTNLYDKDVLSKEFISLVEGLSMDKEYGDQYIVTRDLVNNLSELNDYMEGDYLINKDDNEEITGYELSFITNRGFNILFYFTPEDDVNNEFVKEKINFPLYNFNEVNVYNEYNKDNPHPNPTMEQIAVYLIEKNKEVTSLPSSISSNIKSNYDSILTQYSSNANNLFLFYEYLLEINDEGLKFQSSEEASTFNKYLISNYNSFHSYNNLNEDNKLYIYKEWITTFFPKLNSKHNLTA